VCADLGITGLLHLDGLVDAADGLLPHLTRERRLAVMADPGVGAYGVGVATATMLLRWSALTAIEPSVLLLAGVWCASRTSMAAAIDLVPYARVHGGIATAFMDERENGHGVGAGARVTLPAATVLGLSAALALGVVVRPVAGPLAIASGTLASAGVVGLGWRRLGGFTGDVLGAAGMVGETVALLVVAGHW
jgi:adenosylcobinamide-GDP ribazoletransferase